MIIINDIIAAHSRCCDVLWRFFPFCWMMSKDCIWYLQLTGEVKKKKHSQTDTVVEMAAYGSGWIEIIYKIIPNLNLTNRKYVLI